MKKETLKQHAYNIIKDKIINCEYAPSALLNEEMLKEDVQASRTPIRDALGRLEQEGLVTILPKKARGHRKYFRRKNFRESGLDETECFPYNKDEPHTIEHRGAGKPAEIAHRACPLT